MKITEDTIKKLVSEVMEESKVEIEKSILSHLREGDEEEQDTEEADTDTPDDTADGAEDNSGDDDSEPEEKDPNEEISKLSDRVAQGFNTPKNLTLNDGTQTHIATDSEDQIGDIDQDQKNYEITFERGNWGTFVQSAQQYSQKVTVIRQTVVPLLEKALIELLNNSGAYERASFVTSAVYKNDVFRVVVEMHYTVDLWLGLDFTQSAIEADQGYIYQTLSMYPNMEINSVKIDTSKGDLQVIVSV